MQTNNQYTPSYETLRETKDTEDYEQFLELWAQVHQDLVQRAVYNATASARYRKLVGSMAGHLADLQLDSKNPHYAQFVKHYHSILALIAESVYSQALVDSVEMPNTTDEIRAYFPPNPDNAEYKAVYDLLYDLPYPREEGDF